VLCFGDGVFEGGEGVLGLVDGFFGGGRGGGGFMFGFVLGFVFLVLGGSLIAVVLFFDFRRHGGG